MRDRLITAIKGAKVVEVYEINDIFEIVYQKDGIKKSLTIYHTCHFGPMANGCYFELSGIGLPLPNNLDQKLISTKLKNIDTIEEIHIYAKSSGGYDSCYYEDLEIVYKNKDNHINTYFLHSAPDEEEVHRLDIYHNKASKLDKIEFENIPYPKELYSIDIYKNALAFALKAHGKQKTPNGLPYSFHIVSVANEIINSLSIHHISYDEANVAISCALLHDVNEDTSTKVSKYTLEIENIDEIVAGVEALTKNTMLLSKKEQIQDSLERLKRMPDCIQMVKLADRITNLDPAPGFWNESKRKAYVEEAKKIYEALKKSNAYLAAKLKEKIENYKVKGDDKYLGFYLNVEETAFLTLDKSHPAYLKTFKALNRLNASTIKKYDIALFENNNLQKTFYINSKTPIIYDGYKNYPLSVVEEKIESVKNDEKVVNYMDIIYEGEGCIV